MFADGVLLSSSLPSFALRLEIGGQSVACLCLCTVLQRSTQSSRPPYFPWLAELAMAASLGKDGRKPASQSTRRDKTPGQKVPMCIFKSGLGEMEAVCLSALQCRFWEVIRIKCSMLGRQHETQNWARQAGRQAGLAA